jgi:hypothetical protein
MSHPKNCSEGYEQNAGFAGLSVVSIEIVFLLQNEEIIPQNALFRSCFLYKSRNHINKMRYSGLVSCIQAASILSKRVVSVFLDYLRLYSLINQSLVYRKLAALCHAWRWR